MSANSTTTTETTTTTTVAGISASDIAEAAANPHSFSVEGLSQTNHSISELIAADKYLRKRALMARGGACALSRMISHAIPPGTCDR